ncbi:TPA: hypothetical protein ACXJQT_003725 [Clostridioides difficile]
MSNNQNRLNERVNQSNCFIAIMILGGFVPIIEECIFRVILIKLCLEKDSG